MRTIFTAVIVSLAASNANAQSEHFGKWVSLFDGKSTSGWRNAKGPNAKAEKRCDWVVEDGALTNNREKGAKGVDVCTIDEFGDYELELEYKNPVGSGNSGVYLRGQVEVQVLATPKDRKDLSPGDLGGIYGVAPPKTNPLHKPGEWNQFRILHAGHWVTVWHNGVLVQDEAYAPNATGGSMADYAPPGSPAKLRGPLMLQGDHDAIWYRGIRIRKLCDPEDGWKPLWNGKDLSEFTLETRAPGDAEKGIGAFWKVEDGALTNARWGGGGGGGRDIHTAKPYGNFLLHYEYRSDPKVEGGNSGFYLRDQWEIQILRTSGPDQKHGDGAFYSIKAPDVLARHADPEAWNRIDVKLEGMKVWVWQNGKLIHDGVELPRRTDGDRPTLEWSKRPFKLQGDHGRVWFRNLWIKELPDTPGVKIAQ